jgi:hypothetical protein
VWHEVESLADVPVAEQLQATAQRGCARFRPADAEDLHAVAVRLRITD